MLYYRSWLVKNLQVTKSSRRISGKPWMSFCMAKRTIYLNNCASARSWMVGRSCFISYALKMSYLMWRTSIYQILQRTKKDRTTMFLLAISNQDITSCWYMTLYSKEPIVRILWWTSICKKTSSLSIQIKTNSSTRSASPMFGDIGLRTHKKTCSNHSRKTQPVKRILWYKSILGVKLMLETARTFSLIISTWLKHIKSIYSFRAASTPK